VKLVIVRHNSMRKVTVRISSLSLCRNTHPFSHERWGSKKVPSDSKDPAARSRTTDGMVY